MAIPKIIHYCWFGNSELDELSKKCIETWKRFLPDYEIIKWSEENFDINSNKFVKEAYETKKWAFVADYVRLYALKKYGGIYLDTDVEVIKNLDKFLTNKAFMGRENEEWIATAIIGIEKENKLIEELLDYYEDRSFIKEDGSYDTLTNVKIITNILLKKGLEKGNNTQELKDITIYPKEYFSPDIYEVKKNKKNNTFTIHHFNGSWLSKKDKFKVSIVSNMNRFLGKRMTQRVIKLKKYIFGRKK